jgi:xanthine dehydrogenase accessory factor
MAAREALATGERSLREYQLTEDLAWNTGLVCGGTMWILAEPGERALSGGGRDMLPEVVRAAAGGSPVAVVTRLDKAQRGYAFGGRAIVRAGGELVGTLDDASLDAHASSAAVAALGKGPTRLVRQDDGRELLIEPVTGRPRLVIAGGGHVAKAIARQAQLLDFDVTIIEDRPEFARAERFEGATVLAGDMAETIASLSYGAQDYVIVATRGHKMDADCVLAAARTDARYIGLLGSRRKTILIAGMLREHGVADDRLSAIHAPIGLDLGGRTPAEIALAILAEIVQLRYGGTGRELRSIR